MASFHVVALFTKIPLELAVDVVLHRLEFWIYQIYQATPSDQSTTSTNA